MRFLSQIQAFFVPVSLAMDPEGLRRGRILVNAALFLTCFSILFIGLFFISGNMWGFGVSLWTLFATLGILLYYRASGKIRLTGHLFVADLFIFSTWFSLVLGGLNSPQMAWYLTVPITAFLIVGQGAGYLWTMGTMAGLLLFFFFPPAQRFLLQMESEGARPMHFVGLSGLILYFLMIVDVYEKGRVTAMEQLDRAQRKIMGKNKMLEKQKRAIKHQNQAIHEQNNVLEKQYEEIVNINTSLEKIIHERTFKLKEALHDLDTFLYESSHALRRPISSILGLLQVIKMESNPDLRAELSLRLEDTVKGMDNMLQKLIFINTINQEYDFDEEVNFAEAINTAKTKHEKLLREKDIQFTISPQVESIKSSQHLIYVILDNLLENAFVFAETSGRKQSKVEVSTAREGDNILLTITDNGIGIPAHCQDRIFDLFYRASMMSMGNGLGLYMVKKVVERLHGFIEVHSEERNFTTFKITIPPVSTTKKKSPRRAEVH